MRTLVAQLSIRCPLNIGFNQLKDFRHLLETDLHKKIRLLAIALVSHDEEVLLRGQHATCTVTGLFQTVRLIGGRRTELNSECHGTFRSVAFMHTQIFVEAPIGMRSRVRDDVINVRNDLRSRCADGDVKPGSCA